MNLYQKHIGVDRCRSFEKSEEKCEELLDRLIKQIEMNQTSLKCKGTTETSIKGLFCYVFLARNFKFVLNFRILFSEETESALHITVKVELKNELECEDGTIIKNEGIIRGWLFYYTIFKCFF
jgi:hypothetical protein